MLRDDTEGEEEEKPDILKKIKVINKSKLENWK